MFQDTDATSKPCVILSSVHKAKGLEWNRVWLLTETFRKGKGVEEDNIWYVAVTRAKQSLFLVGAGTPENDQVKKSYTCDAEKPNDSRISRAERIAELKKLKTPDNEILSIIRLEFPERKVAEFKLPTIPDVSPCTVKFLPGDIIANKNGEEFVCYKSNDSAARFTCVTQPSNKFDRCSTYDPRVEQIIRRMDETELTNFLAGKTGARKVQTNPGEESNNSMATKTKTEKAPKTPKTSAPKTTSKLAGAAEYVRTRYNEGANKTTVFAEVVEKWPAFSHDKVGLESRWNTAERIAKNQKEKAKAEKAAEKAPARPAKSDAKAPAKKSAAPTPPAHKKKTTTTEAPASTATEVPPPRTQTTETASTGA